jgi:hypothetical protein
LLLPGSSIFFSCTDKNKVPNSGVDQVKPSIHTVQATYVHMVTSIVGTWARIRKMWIEILPNKKVLLYKYLQILYKYFCYTKVFGVEVAILPNNRQLSMKSYYKNRTEYVSSRLHWANLSCMYLYIQLRRVCSETAILAQRLRRLAYSVATSPSSGAGPRTPAASTPAATSPTSPTWGKCPASRSSPTGENHWYLRISKNW